MKLVTQEEYDAMMSRTRVWAKKHVMFRSAITSAAYAAAEFSFNQEGKTMYVNHADVD